MHTQAVRCAHAHYSLMGWTHRTTREYNCGSSHSLGWYRHSDYMDSVGTQGLAIIVLPSDARQVRANKPHGLCTCVSNPLKVDRLAARYTGQDECHARDLAPLKYCHRWCCLYAPASGVDVRAVCDAYHPCRVCRVGKCLTRGRVRVSLIHVPVPSPFYIRGAALHTLAVTATGAANFVSANCPESGVYACIHASLLLILYHIHIIPHG